VQRQRSGPSYTPLYPRSLHVEMSCLQSRSATHSTAYRTSRLNTKRYGFFSSCQHIISSPNLLHLVQYSLCCSGTHHRSLPLTLTFPLPPYQVLPLLGALTEKLTLCTETISIRDLASAMYGLQGMEISSPEIKQMIAAMSIKLAAADEIDATSLGNCLYSLQVRLNSPPLSCLSFLLHPIVYPLLSHLHCLAVSPFYPWLTRSLLYPPCRESTTPLPRCAHY
jgi:hypothetical protein